MTEHEANTRRSIDELDERQRRELLADLLVWRGRCVQVAMQLDEAAAGKRPPPDAEQCRELSNRLETPDNVRTYGRPGYSLIAYSVSRLVRAVMDLAALVDYSLAENEGPPVRAAARVLQEARDAVCAVTISDENRP